MHELILETTRQTPAGLARQPARDRDKETADPSIPTIQYKSIMRIFRDVPDAKHFGSDVEILHRREAQWEPHALLGLQRRLGNRLVQRVVTRPHRDSSDGDLAPEVEQTILAARGGGQALDSAVRSQMEPAMGADFGSVRVHVDGEADALNRNLGARAFTVGHDIFFKHGEYSPGSSTGRELLAHELTHVVQQNDQNVQTKLTLGQPGDRYEQQADHVAHTIMQQERQLVQKQVESDRICCQSDADEEEKETQAIPAIVQTQPTRTSQAQVIRRSLADAFNRYRGQCDCGEHLENNCAHFLSDALIRAGYNELDGGVGGLYRRRNGRIVCKAGRPVRARELRDWFAGRATDTTDREPNDNRYWAVYQHDGYPGGHVVIHHHTTSTDSTGTSYTSAGTGDFPTWPSQSHYTW